MSDDMLSRRAINRATMERQLLLSRRAASVQDAIETTIALNAQDPNSPYIWLWSRLDPFRFDHLTTAIEDRTVVRSVLLRATQHLVSAADFGWLRSVLRPLLERVQRNVFGKHTAGIAPEELAAAARELLQGRTMTRPELGLLLAERWPGRERGVLAWSAQYLEPMLHPAPSGTWNQRGTIPVELAADRLGTHNKAPDPALLVRRYLAAYGPATVADIRAWSGVAGLREVVAGFGPQLRRFRDESGRTLIDLPDAPRPSAETPAPVRFLPEFDNLLLAYADRRRVMTDEIRARVCVGDAVYATVLVDGSVAAMWTRSQADLVVTPLVPLPDRDRAEIEAEGVRLLRFLAGDDTSGEVRFA